ncbi:MAG: hypothetical protein ABIB97_02695, partial [Patescibacteria group bacterium]
MGLVKNKKLNLVISGSIVVILLFCFASFQPGSVQSAMDDDITGFAWFGANCIPGEDCNTTNTGAIGWISMNCYQPGVFDECGGLFGYGVDIGPPSGGIRDITGYAWIGTGDPTKESEAHPIGWINFDEYPIVDWDLADYTDAHVDAAGNMYGWARIHSIAEDLSADNGWIRFRCEAAECGANSYGVTIDLDTGDFLDGSFAWAGHHDEGGLGWIDFSGVAITGGKPVLVVQETDLGPTAPAEADSYVRLQCAATFVPLGSNNFTVFEYKKASDSSWSSMITGTEGYSGTPINYNWWDWSSSGIEVAGDTEDYEMRCRVCAQEANCTENSDGVPIELTHVCDSDFCED